MRCAAIFLAALLGAAVGPAAAQWSYPEYSGPERDDERRTDHDDLKRREDTLRRREREAQQLAPSLGRDKAAACREYSRRLEEVRNSAREGGDARHMEHLNELRRRINAAQFKAGC